ncbi:MAG: polyketide cyclase [Nocardioides sp.]|nr:polyketide cyclase [Nocardioides sp.]
MRHHYRFESRWVVDHARPGVHAVLADVLDYPSWWPQVRRVTRRGERSGDVVCRSFLPFALKLRLTATVEDPEGGVLEVEVGGDLDGWCRWDLATDGQATRLSFTQEVEARSGVLRAAAFGGRPLLEANHAWMMRGCRQGLERRLSEPAARTAR